MLLRLRAANNVLSAIAPLVFRDKWSFRAYYSRARRAGQTWDGCLKQAYSVTATMTWRRRAIIRNQVYKKKPGF